MMKADIIEKLKSILSKEDLSMSHEEVKELEEAYQNSPVSDKEQLATEADSTTTVSEKDTMDKEFEELMQKIKVRLNGTKPAEDSTADAIAEEREQAESEEKESEEVLSESDVEDDEKVEQQEANADESTIEKPVAAAEATVEKPDEEKPKEEVGQEEKPSMEAAPEKEDEEANETTIIAAKEKKKEEPRDTAEAIVEESEEGSSEEENELLSESDVADEEEEETTPEASEEKEVEQEPGKEGIVKRLKSLLEEENIPKIRQAVKDLIKQYKIATREEIEEQKKEWEKAQKEKEEASKTEDVEATGEESEEEAQEFTAQENPLDKEFESLLDEYGKKAKEHAEKVKAEREKNLNEKKQILDELEALVKNEENIGKMFSVFNDLQSKWNDIGHIPGDQYREVQDKFHRLKDEFYYNVDIYKQLKEHDLHINEKHKQELIDKIKEVKKVKSIKEREALVKTYQREWMNQGPSPRETYKEMADEFFGTCREIFDEFQKHYDKLHADQEENLEKKRALIQKMEELLALEIKNHGTWKKKTDEVIGLQKEWKSIGFAPREHNEKVWEEFRGHCDIFFDNKRKFYDQRREEQNKNKAQKEALVEKAKSLQDSDDWKNTTKSLINMQDEWKAVGPASQKDEQRLWQSFRGACDKFFSRKKEFFSGMDERQEENLEKKNKLIKEIEEAELSGDKNKDISMLKEFSQRFNEIGYVPKKNLQEVYDRYNKALDEKYDKLNLDRQEKAMMNYKQRVDSIQDASDSDFLVRKEKRLLHDKIDRLKQRVIQYENNMEFLSGDGAGTFIKEYEKKISSAKREIDEIKEKLDMLP